MPGFNVDGLGGDGPSNVMEIRRKHRWTFVALGRGLGNFSQAELLVLQSASRPSVKFEEPEMHHNQEVARFAGKQDWDPVTLVWYDVEQDPDVSRGIYLWLNTVSNLRSVTVAHPSTYKRQAVLQLENGFGQADEEWQMYGAWPQAVNWQELDYTSTDLLTIEATMRYDRAVSNCVNNSGRYPNPAAC